MARGRLMPTPTTRVDQDKLVDPVARDDHARKLVGEKAMRDKRRFLRLAGLPLSARDTLGALLGAIAVMALLVVLAIALAA